MGGREWSGGGMHNDNNVMQFCSVSTLLLFSRPTADGRYTDLSRSPVVISTGEYTQLTW